MHRLNRKSESLSTANNNQIANSSSSSFSSLKKLKNSNNSYSSSNHNNSSSSLPFSSSNNSKYVNEQRSKARDIVVALQRKDIKLIAIDFDKTFLSIHTMGYYQGATEKLLDYIRSTFYYLIQELLDHPSYGQSFHFCIVSFSSQEQLIRKLLQLAFKTSKTSSIIIRCNTVEFMSNINDDAFLGKEYHLTSVITEIATRRNKTIQPHEVLLLDDDVSNILIAEEFSHKALEIRDEINLDILKDFVTNYL